MKLSNLLIAMEPYEIITVIYLSGEETRILYSGGSQDLELYDRDYEVIMFQKERDGSYAILLK